MQNVNIPYEDGVMKKGFIAGIIFLFAVSSLSTAATINVNPDGSGDYTTLQEALDAAVSLVDEIVVASGVYSGPGNVNLDFQGKGLTIRRAEGAGACIINCQGQARAFLIQKDLTDDADSIVIDGFMIVRGYDFDFGGGIECDGASPTIKNCVFVNCLSFYGGAIDCFNSSAEILDCVFQNNSAEYAGGAIECYSNSDVKIEGCLFEGNTAEYAGGGIDCAESSLTMTIVDCVFEGNSANFGGAVNCYKSDAEILNCLMTSNAAEQVGGAICIEESSPLIAYCTVVGNTASEESGSIGGIFADELSVSPQVNSCVLWGNGVSLSDSLGMSDRVTYSCVEGGALDPTNTGLDPEFRTGDGGAYYLSQVAAGQVADSPCAGTGDAALTVADFDPSGYSTRTDNQVDDVTPGPDMGYHYPVGAVPAMLTLTADIVPDAADPNLVHGSITVAGAVVVVLPSVTTHARYSEVELLAIPDIDGDGYRVVGWQGVDTGVDIYSPAVPAPLTVTMLEDRVVRVEFTTETMHKLTVEIIHYTRDDTPPGTVSVAWPSAPVEGEPGKFWIREGDVAWITVVPDLGYQVRYWTGTGDDNSYLGQDTAMVSVYDDTTVTVELVPSDDAHLDVDVIGGNGGTSPRRAYYNVGELATITAYPDDGYRVAWWNGADQDPDDPNKATVVMDWDKTVRVGFELIPLHPLIVDVVLLDDGFGHGYTDPNGGWFREGDTIGIRAIPSMGYELDYWVGDGAIRAADANYYDVDVVDGPVYVRVAFREAGLDANTITLNGDPAVTFATIQDAIDAAVDGDSVVVARGTYSGPGNMDLDLLSGDPVNATRAVTVMGEFGPADSIIDCGGQGRGFVFNEGTSVIHVVMGFTITNGLSDRGGAIYVAPNATPFFGALIIKGNHATAGGGAIFFDGAEEDTSGGDPGGDTPADFIPPNFDNDFDGTNESWDLNGDGFIDATNDATDTDGDGVPDVGNIDGARIPDAGEPDPDEPEIPAICTYSIIENNTSDGPGGAIAVTMEATPWINNCIIAKNRAGGPSVPPAVGGAVYSEAGAAPEFINCLVTQNRSTDIGGAFYLWESDAIIRLCTIIYNDGLDYGDFVSNVRVGPKGGIAARDASPEINHCIIGRSGSTDPNDSFGWGFDFSAGWGDDLYECEATYSLIENGDAGTGNISGDPLFVSGPFGDFYLSQPPAQAAANTSPAVNAGEQYALGDILAAYFLPGEITTSVVSNYDFANCDIGYHYPRYSGPPITYNLIIRVIGEGRLYYEGDGGDPNGWVYPFPDSPMIIEGLTPGDTISFLADPNNGHRVYRWSGTDDDLTYGIYNSVLIDGDNKVVFVEFEPSYKRTFNIPGNYSFTQVQNAIDDTRDGDTIILHSGTYNGIGFEVFGKDITISSAFPNDPDYVASVVFDFTPMRGGSIYIFGTGITGRGSVLNGITIVNAISGQITEPAPGPDAGLPGRTGMDRYGSALIVNGDHIIANVVIRDCEVYGNHASNANGGSADDADGGQGADGGDAGGAGLYIGSRALLSSLNSISNISSILMFSSGGSPIIKNCTITNCLAVAGNGSNGGDGARGVRAGDAGVAGRVYGGGVFCDEDTSPTFIDCTITNNTARGGIGGDGGTAPADGGRHGWGGMTDEFRFLTSRDVDDPATYSAGDSRQYSANGGGVYLGGPGFGRSLGNMIIIIGDDGMITIGDGGGMHATFTNCTVANNITQGAISGRGGGNQSIMPPAYHYQIPSFGSGVYCSDDSDTVFTECSIYGNRAEPHPDGPTYDDYFSADHYYGYGGGICIQGSDDDNPSAEIVNTHFGENFSPVGGGIYWIDSEVMVADSNFVDNTSFIGGGIYLFDSIDSLITRTLVQGNAAFFGAQAGVDPNGSSVGGVMALYGSGGGIFSYTSDVLISDCVITENRSSGSGGGVYLGGDPNALKPIIGGEVHLELFNCLVTDNTAYFDGGGVSVNWNAEPNITNCTIADNIVTKVDGYGGGLFCSSDSNTLVTDSIIWGNTGANGSQIAVTGGGMYYPMPSDLRVLHSDIYDYQDREGPDSEDPSASAIRPGFDSSSLAATNDGSTGAIDIGFVINLLDVEYSSLYVNNNGSVTLGAPLGGIAPDALTSGTGNAIIAPFFADVDTTNPDTDVVTYGFARGTVNGHNAIGVNWSRVGYEAGNSDKLNTFQLVIIDLSDEPGGEPGDFAIEFNYEKIRWETGDNDGGVNGLGGASARAGFSDGTGIPGTFYELAGSGVIGGFLDDNLETGLINNSRNSEVPGRYVFFVTEGLPVIPGASIFVEENSKLHDWDAQGQVWTNGTGNINGDPLFIGDYFLEAESPCIDAGSQTAEEAGLSDPYTTRIEEGIVDSNDVDMGYHHLKAAILYQLKITMVEDPDDPDNEGQLDPAGGWYLEGEEITVTVIPPDGYGVKGWYNSDDVLVSTSNELEIVIDQDNEFRVEFRRPVTTEVSGGGDALIDAISTAVNGDTLIVWPDVYNGGIDLGGRQLTITSVNPDDSDTVSRTIIDCGAGRRGFTFDNEEDENTVINGLTFVNGGVPGESGGSLYFGADTSPVIKNVRIVDSTTDVSGGGIYIGPRSSPTFINVVIENCTAFDGDGGGVYIGLQSSPTFINCLITNCFAQGGSGGAVYCSTASEPVFDNCLFNGNSAEVSGGAIAFGVNCTSVITGCSFRGNDLLVAGGGNDNIGDGGAIFYGFDNELAVADCNFINNTGDHGGALYVHEGSTGTVEHSRLRRNVAARDGGAICLNRTGTEAEALEVIDCAVADNVAMRGGGLFTINGTGNVISGSSFRRNVADQTLITNLSDPGGSVSVTAGFGGGIHVFGESISISDTSMDSNRASDSGGGIYLAGDSAAVSSAAPNLFNCLISRNTAGNRGGGISCDWLVRPTLSNCTIADNKVTGEDSYGGGLYCSYESQVVVIDSIIWANIAQYGSQIAVRDLDEYDAGVASLDITYSDIGPLYDPNFTGVGEVDPFAIALREGFDEFTLPANDDQSVGPENIGFDIDFFGVVRNQLYVNNNGNVTFDFPFFGWTPFALTGNIGFPIMAPFLADVDTRGIGSDVVTYGQGTVDGHRAFGVNWILVGYFFMNGDRVNSFQMILIEREDRGPGDFDIEFNYDLIEWETGDISGVGGLGGLSARVGFSNGTGVAGTFFEFPGSGVNGALLDTNTETGLIHNRRNSSVLGRYLFFVRNGLPEGFMLFGRPVHIDEGSIVNGEVITGFDPNTWTWDPNTTFNVVDDPLFVGDDTIYGGDDPLLFVGGYMLSQIDAGQVVDSNCVNYWEGRFAVDAGLEAHTTRTNSVPEGAESLLDIGYHYRVFELRRYELEIQVIDNGDGEHGTVELSPAHGEGYITDQVVTLTAKPETGYRVRRWIGTEDDVVWQVPITTVIMDSDKIVRVEFEEARTRDLLVPGVYDTIEEAVAAASPGDRVVVSRGVHLLTDPDGIDFEGKAITLMSTVPDNPAVVAATIIDCQGARYDNQRAFHFHSGEGRDAVVTGFTIRNGYIVGSVGLSGVIPGDEINFPPDGRITADHGEDVVGDGYGGAILCEDESSPTFSYCVITDCLAMGGYGGDGDDGANDFYNNGVDGEWAGNAGNGSGNGYGGAVACLNESNPAFRDCSFIGNFARGGRGGDGGAGGSGNNAGSGGDGGASSGTGMGGAIYSDRGSSPRCFDCRFDNNTAAWGIIGEGGPRGEGGDGTPVASSGITGQFYNNLFYGSWFYSWINAGITFAPTDDRTTVAGGAAYFDERCNGYFIGCTFHENSAYEVYYYLIPTFGGTTLEFESVPVPIYTIGGAIFAGEENALVLRNCDFTSNLGGGVYCKGGNEVDIDDCMFSQNESVNSTSYTTDYFSSAWYGAYYMSTIIYDAFFSGYNRTAPGGAIYVGPGGNVDINSCNFYSNAAYSSGGAVSCKSDVHFGDCSFDGNRAGGYGGAVDIYNDTDPNRMVLELAFDNCSFTGNKATWGGGIYAHDFNVLFNNCYFIDNESQSGGGLFLADGDAVFTHSIIRDNTATDNDLEELEIGALDVSRMNLASLEGLDGVGGGIACMNTSATFKDCTVEYNEAVGSHALGGGISFFGGDGNESLEHKVINSVFADNSATVKGGAISCDIFTRPEIRNSTFYNNMANLAGGAVSCDWTSSVSILDSIFDNCNSHAISEEWPKHEDVEDSLIQYCVFNNNSDGDYGIFFDNYVETTGIFTFEFTDPDTGADTTVAGDDLHASNIVADPVFVAGPLGRFYLDQATSPAVLQGGSDSPANLGMDTYTTDAITGAFDDDAKVDIGVHYLDPNTIEQYELTLEVVDGENGHGTLTADPPTSPYYAGTVVTLTASPEFNYRVAQWSGGTVNDDSKENTNIVIMGRDKTVTVQFDQPRTLVVGSQPEYTSLQHAIDDAYNGDVILIKTGDYLAPFPYGEVIFSGKNLTISGMNPDDADITEATVLEGYQFWLTDVGADTIIEGITIRRGNMRLQSASPIIRNCAFVECNWIGVDGINGPDVPPDIDGGDGVSVFGGAIEMYDSSPQILGCTFDDCSVTGGDGGLGDNGTGGHVYGYDGGWAGRAYGGAVYAAWNSNPIFKDCVFTNCLARGGNGGDGGDGLDGAHGGRGGSWLWSDAIEEDPTEWFWWDGWENGDKFGTYGWYYWFGWYGPADEWVLDWVYDPYDRYYEYWEYSGYGGAFFCETDCSPKFYNCRFEDNQTFHGICGLGGDGIPPRTPSRRMDIETAGGAVFISEGCDVEFVDSLIMNNFSDTSTIDDADDYYVSFGGGVAVEKNSSVTFENCEIQGNEATIGGGVYWVDSDAEFVEDCNVVRNAAYHGGGMYSSHSTGLIDRTFFTSNVASAVQAVEDSADPSDPNGAGGGSSGYAHDVLGQGGGYYSFSTLVDISDSVFKKNMAKASGGGLYFGGSDENSFVTPTVHNSLLAENTAGRDGGGISVNWYSEPEITNCTISDNIVTGSIGAGFGYGGGIYVSYNSRTFISDSIIWDNSGSNGAQIAVGSGDTYGPRVSEVVMVYSDVGPRFDPNAMDDLGIFDDVDMDLEPIGGSQAQRSGQKLVEPDSVYSQFDAGAERASVIVTLSDFEALRRATDWSSSQSRGVLHQAVSDRINVVLDTLDASEFEIRYRYRNFAGFACDITQAGLNKLLSNSLVAHVEPERYYERMLAQAIPLANALMARQVYDGTNISVAIVDDGIDYTHPMLGAGVFPNSKVVGGYDIAENDPDPMPIQIAAHGTACAGIAAGNVGNVGDYIGGVAFGSRLFALRVFDDNDLFAAGAGIAAWDWCVTNQYINPQNPIMVISNSWGIRGLPFNDSVTADAFSPALTAAADTANEAGITILAASGNDGFAGQGISHPAAMSKVISVGAVFDTTDMVAPYSNTGELLDILAPGDPIYTTDIVGPGGYDPGDYEPAFNGTSAACPFAAGAVASIQSAAMDMLGRVLSPEEVRTLLIATGVPIMDTKVAIIKPRVNLGAAIAGLSASIPIYVEEGCELYGWDPNNEEWDPDTFNFMEDPLFVGDYFLSEIDSLQLENSPCVPDKWPDGEYVSSGTVIEAGLAEYTTRSDSELDEGMVNLGFHHFPFEVERYKLTYFVIVDPFELPGFEPEITPYDPNGLIYYYGTQVELTVTPPPFGFHTVWTGTDDDSINEPNNVVTMDDDKIVMVTFETIGYILDVQVIVDANILPDFDGRLEELDPPGRIYYPNTEVTITVTEPPEGFQVRWSGADDNTVVDPINTVTMTSDKEVIASYVPIQTDYYAVLVGISDYFDQFASMIEFPYASRDARELGVRLAESPNWDEDNIYVLIDSQATKAEIRNLLEELSDKLDHDDVFVFYFSGDGIKDVDIEPIDEIDDLDEYLVTYEYDGIRDDELGQMLADFATDNYVVLIETDYAAGQIDGIDPSSSVGAHNLNVPLRLSNTITSETPLSFNDDEVVGSEPQDLNRNEAGVVLTACGVDEIAFYSDDFRHGVFTYYLLRAIEGPGDWSGDNNGRVSAEEAYDYLARRVDAYIDDMVSIGNLPIGTTQRPRIYDADDESEIDILDVDSPDREPKTWYVPGDAERIQEAVDNAKDGDVIVLTAGTYSGGAIIVDKSVTITSTNPDDPDVVARTVLDLSSTEARFAIYFTANAGPETVLNGITITANGWIRYIIGSTDGSDGGDIFSSGLIIGSGASPRIQNCVISGFELHAGRGGDGDEDDTNFLDGDGGDGGNAFGGGVYCLEESSPTFVNTTISDCRVFGGDGGNGAAVNEYNFGAGRGGWGGWARGGGVFVSELAEPLFINCTISNCIATGGNGGNGGNGGTVDDVPYPPGYGGSWSDGFYYPWQLLGYEGNYTLYSAYGGGIYCAPDSKSKFIDCVISGNSTQGGLSGLGGDLGDGALAPGMTVSRGRIYPFEMYEIPSYGGGVYCAPDSLAEFEGCTISLNTAVKPTTVRVVDPALGYGGGIVFDRSESARLVDCLIRGNEASIGGGVYWYDNDMLVADCNIMDNLAFYGGGLYGTRGETVITGGIIHGNVAGATETDTAEVVGRGGGIHLASITAWIRDAQFFGNQASASGGGIFLTGTEPNTIMIKNCLLVNNKAGREGGGVSSNWFAQPILSNCTFSENWATGYFGFTGTGLDPNGVPQGGGVEQVDFESVGGGLFCGYESTAVVIDSIFYHNYAANGRQLAVGTGFEWDPRPGTLTISFSDVQGGRDEPATFVEGGPDTPVEERPVLNWEESNIIADPLFVRGLWGGFYLSQIVAGQSKDSLCVDAGSDFASETGMDKYTTRSDDAFETFDVGDVDMGFHYPLKLTMAVCRFCDLVFDGIVDTKDMAAFALAWLDQCDEPEWCGGADINTDTRANVADLLIFASCWLVEDVVAPIPDPSQWDIKPQPLGDPGSGAVKMSAKVSVDAWWSDQVEYYFECITDRAHSSGWRQNYDPTNSATYVVNPEYYEDTGLAVTVPGTEYTYKVRVRDGRIRNLIDPDADRNETAWSVERTAIPGRELDSPLPDPAMWYGDDVDGDGIPEVDVNQDGIADGMPYPISGTALRMRATIGIDVSGPVEYFFRSTDPTGVADGPPEAGSKNEDEDLNDYDGDGDVDGWQISPIFEDTGLTPGVTYYYRVQVKDAHGNRTQESVVALGVPDPAVVDFNPPLPDPPVWENVPQEFSWPNPVTGFTEYWHWMSVEAVTDPEGNGEEYEFECLEPDNFSGGWFSVNNLPLQPDGTTAGANVYYVEVGARNMPLEYRVRTRDQSPNQERNISGWSTTLTVVLLEQ